MFRPSFAAAALLALGACVTTAGRAGPADIRNDAQGRHPHAVARRVRGRAPGTAGEEKTLAYLVEQFSRAGLQPGNHGSWFQDVPLVEITASNHEPLTIAGKRYTIGQDWVGVSYREVRGSTSMTARSCSSATAWSRPRRAGTTTPGSTCTGRPR
jgi:hypothetical protein